MQVGLAGGVCVSGFFAGHCVFRFSFVLMEDRRCLLGRNPSLPLDNVLSQGGGPLAVEGVLLNSDVIYNLPYIRLPQSPTVPAPCNTTVL